VYVGKSKALKESKQGSTASSTVCSTRSLKQSTSSITLSYKSKGKNLFMSPDRPAQIREIPTRRFNEPISLMATFINGGGNL
jgi:hypothetical protein